MQYSKRSTSISNFQVEFQGLRTVARLEHPGDIDDFGEAIVLAPGLGSPELAGLRHELALLGLAAISFEQPRARPLGWQLRDVAELRAGVVEQVVTQAERQHSIGQTALVCHSLAALDGARVGGRLGERLSSVEHMAGAGFSDDGFCETVVRLGSSAIAETASTNVMLSAQTALHIARNPAQFVLEGIYGSTSDIRPMVAQQAEDGLDIGALQFANDSIFVPHIVTARMAELAIRKAITADTLHACHGSPFDDPAGTALVLHDILASRHPQAPLPRLQVA